MKHSENIFKDHANFVDKRNPPKSLFSIQNMADNSFVIDERFPYHYHDWFELYYLRSGSCIYTLKSKTYYVNENNWIFIPPKLKHKVMYLTPTHDRCLMYFSKDFLNPLVISHINQLIASPIYAPSPKDAALINSIPDKLLYEFENESEFSKELIKGYLLEIFATFLRGICEKSSDDINAPDHNLLVDHVIRYINMHYSEKITLTDLADLTCVGSNYVSRIFKQVTGINLNEYINLVRITHAKKLLNTTNDSITNIAYKCGFNDSNYFSQVFKKFENISPQQYSKMHI